MTRPPLRSATPLAVLAGAALIATIASGAWALNGSVARQEPGETDPGAHVAASTAPRATGSAAQDIARPAAAGLVVTPGSALFDVDLTRGIPEMREVTVTNTATVSYDLQLSIEQSIGAPAEHRMEHLRVFSTGTYDRCDAATMTRGSTRAMSEVKRVSHATINARSTRTLCLGVMLPADAPTFDPAVTVVDLLFHARAEGAPDAADRLAFTGTDAPRLIPAAVLAVLTGVFAVWALRRRTAADIAQLDLEDTTR